MLVFDVRRKTVQYVDTTDGAFRYRHESGPTRTANRWSIMYDEVLPLWKTEGYKARRSHRIDGQLQLALERDWGFTEQRQVHGYCAPLVLLLFCLCQRLQVHDVAAVYAGLGRFVRAFGDRRRLRLSLLVWLGAGRRPPASATGGRPRGSTAPGTWRPCCPSSG